MPVSILVLALVLLVTGLGTTLLGLSLTPTDMGRAWLDVGFTTLTGGIMTLAIGFATRTLATALDRGETASPTPTVVDAPLAMAPSAAEHADAIPAVTLAPEPPPVIAPATLAVGGAAVAAGAVLGASLLGQDEKKPAPSVEELERDLFAQITAEQPPVEPEKPDLLRQDEAPSSAQTERALEPESRPEPEPTSTFELRLGPEPSATEELQSPAATSPTSGLILDEDLAALVAEEAPLAPIDTLEVVGAYDSAGVRFTMYSDGSVNAVAPHGERRYRSLEALRQQLDSGQPAV